VKVEGSFKNPVYVDLITGKAYNIPKKQWKKSGKQFTFTDIPVPDYPVLIAEKSSLLLEGGKQ
jgi:polysaccharide biosynthesis protein PslG